MASFIAMLFSLEIGEQFNSPLGAIRKTDENKFELIYNDRNIIKITQELVDDGSVSEILF